MLNKWEFLHAMFGDKYKITPYQYNFNRALTANNSSVETITILRGKAFILFGFKYTSTGRFEITYDVESERFTSTTIEDRLFTPYQASTFDTPDNDLPFPINVPAGRDIKVSLKDISGAANTINGIVYGVHLTPK
jgi:hypothetical protein